jgi:hypothetical protein
MPGLPLIPPSASEETRTVIVSRLRRLADGFSTSRAIRSPLFGCVAALDGIAITITKPADTYFPRNIFCRKGMYAVPIQAMVDHSYRFLYMSPRCVGSTHDSLGWSCSALAQNLAGGWSLGPFWVAADAAYECLHGLITPWTKGQVSDAMIGTWRDSFNFFHSSNRIHIEQAFGILVGPWGILWRPLRMDVTRFAPILSACLRLHNY